MLLHPYPDPLIDLYNIIILTVDIAFLHYTR